MNRAHPQDPTTSSKLSAWPNERVMPGLASGWEGYAWTWLQQARAELLPIDRRVLRAIAERLELEIAEPSELCGQLFGSGGAATVAALAASLDASLEPLAAHALAAWRASCARSESGDFMHGLGGALMAAAEIDALRPGSIAPAFARALFRAVERSASRWLRAYAKTSVPTGLAHGIAGALLALETGIASFGFAPKRDLLVRAFDALAAEALRARDGACVWTLESRAHHLSRHAWCSGSPGIALSMLASHRLSGRARYAQLAAPALAATVRFDNEDVKNLCCGVAGRCMVLVEAARLTGDRAWLRTARKLASTRLQGPVRREWFEQRGYNFGDLGVRYALRRLERPTQLTMAGLGALSVGAGPR